MQLQIRNAVSDQMISLFPRIGIYMDDPVKKNLKKIDKIKPGKIRGENANQGFSGIKKASWQHLYLAVSLNIGTDL